MVTSCHHLSLAFTTEGDEAPLLLFFSPAYLPTLLGFFPPSNLPPSPSLYNCRGFEGGQL